MKRIMIIICFLLTGIAISAQQEEEAGMKNLDAYLGTWIYQSNDTVFKIVFQRGREITNGISFNGLFGGYYLSVRGVVCEYYMDSLPNVWKVRPQTIPPSNVYIWAWNVDGPIDAPTPSLLNIWFYDKRKKHFEGKGIGGGFIQLLSPRKLLWKLNEKLGIWWETEGDETLKSPVKPIGISVPEEAIMIKQE